MSLEEKQEFLRVTILQQGYDGQAFVAFANDYIGRPLDLDQHSFQNIQAYAKAFLQSLNSQQKTQEVSESKEAQTQEQWQAGPTQPKDNQILDKSSFPEGWATQGWSTPQQPKGSIDMDLLDFLDFPPAKDIKTAKPPVINQPKQTLIPVVNPLSNPIPVKPLISPQTRPVLDKHPSPAWNTQIPSPKKPQPQKKVQTDKKLQLSSEIGCRRIILSKQLQIPNLQVLISQTEICKQGFFGFSYVLYSLHIKPLNLQVKRRYSDFQALRQALKNLFPNLKLPILEKASRISETDPQNTKKQKDLIQCYLAGLLDTPILRLSKIVEDFLLISNPNEFKTFLKNISKIPKPKCIQQLQTTQGKVEVKIGSQFDALSVSASQLLDYSVVQLQKIKYQIEQVSLTFLNLHKQLSQISDSFRAFSGYLKNFDSVFQVSKVTVCEQVLSKLAQLHSQLSEIAKAQSSLYDRNIKTQLKYERNNLTGLRDIIKTRNMLVQQFNKRREKTIAPYPSKSKQKISVDIPSRDTTVLAYQAGAYNTILSKETSFSFTRLGCSLNNLFKQISRMKISYLDTSKTCWQEILDF